MSTTTSATMNAMVALLALGPAIGAEGTALWILIDPSQGNRDFTLFLGWHLVASLLFAPVVRALLPARLRNPVWPTLTWIACCGFFIPVFGVIALVGAALTVLLAPMRTSDARFESLPQPALTGSSAAAGARFRAAGLQGMLFDQHLPSGLRMRSMRVLQNMPMKRAGPLLSRLLDDPVEDLRLTAHALLERESRRIVERIGRERGVLEAATGPEQRLRSLRRMAEHYWELVYGGLATRDLSERAITEGLKFADQALELAPRDAQLWLLRGKLLNASHDPRGARLAYRAATTAGLAPERTASYLAELAFERGDIRAVRDHMTRIDEAVGPTMAPLAQFWQVRTRPGARLALDAHDHPSTRGHP